MTSSRDFPEDFKYENGNYFNTCHICKGTFLGHKRRVSCKLCLKSEDNPLKNDKIKIELTVGQCQEIYDKYGIDSGEHTRDTSLLCTIINKLENELKNSSEIK